MKKSSFIWNIFFVLVAATFGISSTAYSQQKEVYEEIEKGGNNYLIIEYKDNGQVIVGEADEFIPENLGPISKLKADDFRLYVTKGVVVKCPNTDCYKLMQFPSEDDDPTPDLILIDSTKTHLIRYKQGQEPTEKDRSDCRLMHLTDAIKDPIVELTVTTNDGEVFKINYYSTLTELTLMEKNIVDIQGLEKLTDLEELSLDENKLTSIDLSANKKLEIVNLYKNALTEIKGLSSLSELKRLSLNQNMLTSIYVGYNTKLEELLLDENSLSRIGGLNNLSELKRLHFSFKNNQPLFVDLSSNKKLEVLSIINTPLASIKGLSELSELTELWLGYNQLSSIDLSSNKKLEVVSMAHNALTSVTGLNNLLNLNLLNLSDNELETVDISANNSLDKPGDAFDVKANIISGNPLKKIIVNKEQRMSAGMRVPLNELFRAGVDVFVK